MTTTADEKVEDTKYAVQSAVEHLSEVVIKRCWGHEEYKGERISQLVNILGRLIQIREELS